MSSFITDGRARGLVLVCSNETLPQLGAARAYFSDDTWQSANIRWVDLAGLIINVAGPTKWIRWELDTIVERGALTKLIILLPPGRTDEHAARWQNVTSALQPTRWGSSLAMVDFRDGRRDRIPQ
jgi:hypothetical protein